MSRNPTIDVIEQYTETVWNAGNAAAMANFVTDPCLRHEIGELVTISLAENVERLGQSLEALLDLHIRNVWVWADGEYVTSCYEVAHGPGEDRQTISGIEVFRVQDGKITEVWNAPSAPGSWR